MGLFHHGDSDSSSSSSTSTSSSSSSTCSPEPASYYQAAPIAGTWTFHRIIIVTSAALAIVTAIICFGLAMMHLLHYTNRQEQRQLVRATMVPAIFAVFSFFAVWFYSDSAYLAPCADFYECFALVAFFYYMIHVVTPDESKRLAFFSQLEVRGKDGQVVQGGSLAWFYKQWLCVFQILPGRIITTIATWIIVATYCPTGSKLDTAQVIINVVNGIQTALCVIAILRVYGQLKQHLANQRIIAKLVTLKAIVGIQLVQRIVFSILSRTSALNGSATVSYKDLNVGVPNLMTCCEAFIFALGFIYAYSWTPYKTGGAKRSFFPGVVDAWNVADIIRGLFFTLTLRSIAKGNDSEPLPVYERGYAQQPQTAHYGQQAGVYMPERAYQGA